MKKLIYSLMLICFAITATDVVAQAPAQQKAKPKKFHGNPEYYLEVQGSHIFKLVDQALDEYPPVPGASTIRKSILFNLDALLHDTKFDNSEYMREFCDSRVSKTVARFQTPVKKGMDVCKVYNEGFVARTKSVSIAFDLVRGTYLASGAHKGSGYRIVADDQMAAIIDKCDVLFLSHNHADHVDRWVVDKFIAANKPVIAPTQILPDVKGVTHYRSETEVLSVEVPLKTGITLAVKIFPGHQHPIMNNIYVVTTPEGYSVCHTGDQYSNTDFTWIESARVNAPKIDAMIMNCWTPKPMQTVKGFNPRYVITAHENEMGHSIDHREAFWLTFDKFKECKYPYVVMAWGEGFLVK